MIKWRNKIKTVIKKTAKVLLWVVISVVGLLFLLCTVMCIPAVQTFAAQKATQILSQQMQTEVSIEKLRIGFNLDVIFEKLQLKDQRGNNLIRAEKGEAAFPVLQLSRNYIGINHVTLHQADVYLRTYDGDTALNMKFFIDFVTPQKKKEKKTTVDLKNVRLINSHFHLRNDNKALPDQENTWNYNNMILDKINIKLHQLLIIGDSLNFLIDDLSARERSGFEITSFKGKLQLSRSGLYCYNANFHTKNGSHIKTDFGMDYNSFKDFSNFIELVKFNTVLHPSALNTKDLMYFAPQLTGMENSINVAAGKVSGTIENIKVRQFDFAYGQETYIKADVEMMGLPDIKETFIDLDISESKVTIGDLAQLKLPKQKSIPINEMMQKLRWLQIKGEFLGLYDNFFADASLSTALGRGNCELMFNSRNKPITYDGRLALSGLHLGKMLNTDDLGKISINGQIKGKGVQIADMDCQLNAKISSIDYRGNTVENINLEGKFLAKMFDGKIECDDQDFNLNFNGLIDFNGEMPIYNFEADVVALNLSQFRLFRPDSNVILSACITSRLQGNNLENLQGSLSMEDVFYSQQGEKYFFPDFGMKIVSDTAGEKDIKLTSEVLNVNLNGRFTYKRAITLIQERLNRHLPNLVANPVPRTGIGNAYKQYFNFSVELLKPIPLLSLFIPNVQINSGLSAILSIDETLNKTLLNVQIPKVELGKQVFTQLELNGKENEKTFDIHLFCQGLYFSAKDTQPALRNIDLRTTLRNNKIDFRALANGNSKNKINDILTEGSLSFLKNEGIILNLNNGSVIWDNEIFYLDASNYIYYSKDSLYVQNIGLSSSSGKSVQAKSITDGRISKGLAFEFNEIELGLFNVILEPFQISLQGKATGKGKMSLDAAAFRVGSAFHITDFYFNDIAIGYIEGNTGWRDINKKLNIHTSFFQDQRKIEKLFNISGYIDPINRFLDLKGEIDSLDIRFLQRYLSSFASKLEGYGKGNLSFAGNFSNPKLTGSIALKNAILGIDYLKTEYKIEGGSIDFVDSGFIFNKFQITDNLKGKGKVSGTISHRKLKDFRLNLKIQAENLLALRTTAKDNNRFYGRAFADGTVSITGNASQQIRIRADVTTKPQTDITLSLDWSETSSESNFITFVSKEKSERAKEKSTQENTESTVLVNLIVNATPDATVRVLLDPSIGGNIVARGSGTIEMAVDENSDLSLYGRYTIVGGEFVLAFYDLLTRSFKLENGSYLSWNGRPTQGIINVRASQSAKVSVNKSTDEPNNKQRIAVNNYLNLNGQLLNPEFRFSFDLPNATEDTKNFVFANVDTTDRQQMVEQLVSILFMGTFSFANSSTADATTLSGIGYSLSEILSHQINKLASSISDNLDVRVAYIPGENPSEREYSVDVGSSWLNDKLVITSSLGMIEQQDVSNNNQFQIDFIAEYKLTKDGSLRAKAFNITNQQDILQSAFNTSTYTQGGGVSYSKEFDRFKDLFIKKRKKKKKIIENTN